MQSIPLSLGLLLAFPLGTAELSADEVRLRDGTLVVGTVRHRGDALEITTREGTVRVDRADVVRIRTEAELTAALQDMASRVADTGFGRLELARLAHRWDLDDQLWHHLEAALAQTPDDRRERLDAFLATLEPEILSRRYRGRPATARVRAMLRAVRPDQPARAAAVLELLVREPDADDALAERARRALTTEQRILAVTAIARRGSPGADRFVYRTTLLDGSEQVRQEAAALSRMHGDSTEAVRYLAPGFLHADPRVRVRTAEAFALLEDPAAIPLLVEAGPNAGIPPQAAGGGNPGVRGHVSITEQRAFVRDFDVEVAQAAFIAKPVVDVIQSGTVLDVTVAAVVTHRIRIVSAYRTALERLSGSDPGRDPRGWGEWLARRSGDGG